MLWALTLHAENNWSRSVSTLEETKAQEIKSPVQVRALIWQIEISVSSLEFLSVEPNLYRPNELHTDQQWIKREKSNWKLFVCGMMSQGCKPYWFAGLMTFESCLQGYIKQSLDLFLNSSGCKQHTSGPESIRRLWGKYLCGEFFTWQLINLMRLLHTDVNKISKLPMASYSQCPFLSPK